VTFSLLGVEAETGRIGGVITRYASSRRPGRVSSAGAARIA